MIYAKTKVKNMPPNCFECPFSKNVLPEGLMCGLLVKDATPESGTDKYHPGYRPKWCPLYEEYELIDKFKKQYEKKGK